MKLNQGHGLRTSKLSKSVDYNTNIVKFLRPCYKPNVKGISKIIHGSG